MRIKDSQNTCIFFPFSICIFGNLMFLFLLRGFSKDTFFISGMFFSLSFLFTILFEQIFPSFLTNSLKDIFARHEYRSFIQNIRKGKKMLIGISIFFAIFLFFSSSFFAQENPNLVVALRMLSFAIICDGFLSGEYSYYFARNLRKPIFLACCLEQGITIILSFFCMLFFESSILFSLVIASIVGKGISFVAFILFDKKYYNNVLRAARKQTRIEKEKTDSIQAALLSGCGFGIIWIGLLSFFFFFLNGKVSILEENIILYSICFFSFLPVAFSGISLEQAISLLPKEKTINSIQIYMKNSLQTILYPTVFVCIFLVGTADRLATRFFDNSVATSYFYWSALIGLCITLFVYMLFLFWQWKWKSSILVYCSTGLITEIFLLWILYSYFKETSFFLSWFFAFVVILFLDFTKLSNAYETHFEDLLKDGWKWFLCALAANGIFSIGKWIGVFSNLEFSFLFVFVLFVFFALEWLLYRFCSKMAKVDNVVKKWS